MCSPYQGESPSPYSDSSSSGVPSPPTVVSAYNRSTDSFNQDGPYLEIVEQPQSRFRFRYKSEMVGTHGQLKAENADKNRPIFPTVKLCNWNKGFAIIRLLLFTAENNVLDRKKHVHELGGKHCIKDTGTCEIVVDDKCNYNAKFQNLGVIHIAKRHVKEIILERKKEDLITHAKLRKPNHTREQINSQISKTDIEMITSQAEDEARTMDLNKIVLRFQAFCYDDSSKSHCPITHPVDSEPVMNLKNASTGELKIVRMSTFTAPCSGGTDVWMLVEKVKKSNVQIKFFEVDNEDKEIWSAYGEFTDSDVHHQYAIVFKTPAYRLSNLNSAVKVKVQLERPSDRDSSEPREFTYLPDNSRKRPNQLYELKLDDAEDVLANRSNNAKRVCTGYAEPLDLTHIKSSPGHHSPNGTVDAEISKMMSGDPNMIFQQTGTAGQFFHQAQNSPQSPPFVVPSPVAQAELSPEQWLYSPPHSGVNNPLISLQVPMNNVQYQPMGSPQQQYQMVVSPASNSLGSPYQSFSQDMPQAVPQYQEVPSPGRVVPSPDLLEMKPQMNMMGQQMLQQSSQLLDLNSTYKIDYNSQQIGDFNYFMGDQQYNSIPNQVQQGLQQQNNTYDQGLLNLDLDHDLLSLEGLPSAGDLTTIDMRQIASDLMSSFDRFDQTSDIKTDYAKKKKNPTEDKTNTDIDELTSKMSNVKVEEDGQQKSNVNSSESDVDQKSLINQKNLDVAFRVAVNDAKCLRAYAATNDIGLLLATNRYLLAVQNNQGDNALHTAVANRNWEGFNKIIKASEKIKPHELLNACNFVKETALHLAIRVNEPGMVARLVGTPGCDLSVQDIGGNTPLHLAAASKTHHCMAALLSHQPSNGMVMAVRQAINEYNYQGETPLHLASITGNIGTMKLLLSMGSHEHDCERKRGGNALHLAVMFRQLEAVVYLLKNTSITVGAGMFDGNTPLHLAVLGKHKEICAELMAAKADPYAKNQLHRRKKSNESDDEDEDSECEGDNMDYYTPIDYAEDDKQILQILLKKPKNSTSPVECPKEPKEEAKSRIEDSGIDISSTELSADLTNSC